MKRCSKCKAEKELSEFYRDRHRLDGYQYNCKACTDAYIKAYESRNRAKSNARRIAWAKRNGWRGSKKAWAKITDYKIKCRLNFYGIPVTPESIAAYRRRIVVARAARAMKFLIYGKPQTPR